jgi:2-polyprenyl-3-methyl-5-hydroxy-6-metoxy-1,4-benzoquinol methylase
MPPEVADLARGKPAQRILELGCGVGRFSRNLARAGHQVVGVDFSPVAIEKARARPTGEANRPEFVVGDVTDLHNVEGPFDLSFDVGCCH